MSQSRPSVRQRVWTLARWLLAPALLAAVLSRVDFSALRAALAPLDAMTLLILSGLAAVMPVLLARRMVVLTRSLARHAPGPRPLTLASVLGDALAASAASTVLPSSIGGDVTRALLVSGYYAGEAAKTRPFAFIVVDRLIGVLALSTPPLLLALLWRDSLFSAPAFVGALALLLVAWQLPRVLSWSATGVPLRWARARDFVDRLASGVGDAEPHARAEAFAWSVVYQLCVGLFFEVLASAWGDGGRVHEAIWIGLPLAAVLTVLPVSIGGIGFRESLFVAVFAFLSLPEPHGLVLGLAWSAVGLAWALAGVVVIAWRSLRGR